MLVRWIRPRPRRPRGGTPTSSARPCGRAGAAGSRGAAEARCRAVAPEDRSLPLRGIERAAERRFGLRLPSAVRASGRGRQEEELRTDPPELGLEEPLVGRLEEADALLDERQPFRDPAREQA